MLTCHKQQPNHLSMFSVGGKSLCIIIDFLICSSIFWVLPRSGVSYKRDCSGGYFFVDTFSAKSDFENFYCPSDGPFSTSFFPFSLFDCVQITYYQFCVCFSLNILSLSCFNGCIPSGFFFSLFSYFFIRLANFPFPHSIPVYWLYILIVRVWFSILFL